jgi:hypothetical protein
LHDACNGFFGLLHSPLNIFKLGEVAGEDLSRAAKIATTHFHEACSNSPESEFRTTSTPLPFVAFRMLSLKDSSRELKT